MGYHEALYYVLKITDEEEEKEVIPPMTEDQSFYIVDNEADWGNDGNT